MRIAHISDLHIACKPGSGEYNAKRCLGYLNYLLFRSRRYCASMAAAALGYLLAKQPDVVVITGDLSQHGLDAEFDKVEELLRPLTDKGIPILTVPGNHDAYGKFSLERFEQLRTRLALGICSDNDGIIRFPAVELAPLMQAVISPLFYSYGMQNSDELARISSSWQKATKNALRLVYGHYPVIKKDGGNHGRMRGLRGGEKVLEFCAQNQVDGYLCGHDHQAFTVDMPGGCRQYAAPALSDVHGNAQELFFIDTVRGMKS